VPGFHVDGRATTDILVVTLLVLRAAGLVLGDDRIWLERQQQVQELICLVPFMYQETPLAALTFVQHQQTPR
jgi:hypothetical protein